MRPVSRTVPAMTIPYTSAPQWIVYMESSPTNYQLSATNQMAFDIFALTNAAISNYVITVAGTRESEVAQTVTVQWRSNDYVTVVSPGTSNSVPYGYFIVPVRHSVGQHPGNVKLENPTLLYGTDPDRWASLMGHSLTGDCEATSIYHNVYFEAKDPDLGSGFKTWWENSLAISLPRTATMTNCAVGLYGQARVNWHGDDHESRVYHAIGIGTNIQSYTAKADIIYTEEESMDWHTFCGTGTVTGKLDSAGQYIPIFSSARGYAYIRWGRTLAENALVDLMILYLP